MNGLSALCRLSWPSPLPARFESGWVRPLINATLFQVGWFVAVLGNNMWAMASAALVLLLHWLLLSRRWQEWLLIAGVVALGYGIDSLMVVGGLFIVPGGGYLAPLWLLAIWMMFATTLCHAFAWLRQRLLVAALLGAIAPPFSYWAGEQLAPLDFSDPLLTLLAVSAIWVILLPLFSLGARYVHR